MHIHPQQDYCHLPSHSKILFHFLPLVSLEMAHPSLLETGPGSPNQEKRLCAIGIYCLHNCWWRRNKRYANYLDTVYDLENLLSILWDPSEMVIVAFVPPNFTFSKRNISFHVKKMMTW
jgi:hypothetical protein